MKKYAWILTFLLGLLYGFAHADDGSWNIVGDGDWNNNANWTGATFPDGAAEVATLNAPNAQNANVSITAPISLRQIASDTNVNVLGSQITFSTGTNINKTTNTTFTSLVYTGVTKLEAGNHIITGSGDATVGVNQYTISLADVDEDGGVASLTTTGRNKIRISSARYSGATTITENSEVIFIKSPSTTSITIENPANLGFDPTAPITYSGPISGGGNLAAVGFNGGSTVSLDGALTYTGLTVISNGGDLNLITSPPNSNAILVNNLTFSPLAGDTQTFNGSIIFFGNLTLNGQGTEILTSNNISLTGTTTVTRGTLNLSSTANITASPVTVNSGANPTTEAILTGQGTISSSLTNTQGVVLPGSSAATSMTVASYTQAAAGIFKIRVTTASASLLSVTNNAALNGTIDLTIANGLYPAGTNFNVLTTGGALNGTTFSALTQDNSGTFQVRYLTDNIVNIFLVNDLIIPNANTTTLIGNSLTSYNCISSNLGYIVSNPDLNSAVNLLLSLPSQQFKTALIKLSSLPYASQTVINEQNLSQMAREFNSVQTCNSCSIRNNGVSVEPITINYRQELTQGELPNIGQIPFEALTYGSKIGYQRRLIGSLFFKMGLAYTHTNLHWKEGFGNSKWSSVYAAPSLGYYGKRFYISFLGLGAANFYETSRHIQFSTINRVAKSEHQSYDVLARGALGLRLPLIGSSYITTTDYIPLSVCFVPEAAVNYITSWARSFSETNAASLNLRIANRKDFMLQPNFRGRLVFEILSNKICLSPVFYAGWLENIYLNNQKVGMRYKGKPGTGFCEIIGFKQDTNQIILGFEFNVKKCSRFEFTANFETTFLNQFQIYSGLLKFQWLF